MALTQQQPDAFESQPATFVCPSLPEQAFANDVLAGLNASPKTLPSGWLYDQRGSELFEEITNVDEYYQTRTEMSIFAQCTSEIGEIVGPDAIVIEFGSGSSRKTPLLLDALKSPRAYVPVDIADEFLDEAVSTLSRRCPGIPMLPVVADFTREFHLPPQLDDTKGQRLGFFPGSTIGNFTREAAIHFLTHVGEMLGKGRRMVIGVDSCKDPSVLVPAYNDARGITAEFNLNIIKRINRELRGTFPPDAFRHESRFNPTLSRIEMHLVAQRAFQASVLGQTFSFKEGETIHTENSHKYGVTEFTELARTSGWAVDKMWMDENKRFAVYLLSPIDN